jgi:hypothetical protein
MFNLTCNITLQVYITMPLVTLIMVPTCWQSFAAEPVWFQWAPLQIVRSPKNIRNDFRWSEQHMCMIRVQLIDAALTNNEVNSDREQN